MITGDTKITDKSGVLDVAHRQDNLGIPSLKVLLVDDESSFITMVRWYVINFGFKVTTAIGGQSALFELTNENFEEVSTLLCEIVLSQPFEER